MVPLVFDSLNHIGHGSEAIDTAEFPFHTLFTKSIADGRTSFDRLETNASRTQVVRQSRKCMRTLQIDTRRGG